MADLGLQSALSDARPASAGKTAPRDQGGAPKKKSRSSRDAAAMKRRCVSTACVACRRRKSKCDGNTPSCAACSSVYGTGISLHSTSSDGVHLLMLLVECVYDPNSDHRRKGVYKEKIDSLKTRNSTLQTLVQAILNANEDDVPALVRQIRTCESLDDVAESIRRQEQGYEDDDEDEDMLGNGSATDLPTFETELSGKMGELRLENGSVRFIGGTSNLLYLSPTDDDGEEVSTELQQQDDPLTSWTRVTKDTQVIVHLVNMYFTWHYPYFTTLSKSLFYRDFLLGKPPGIPKRTVYCSSLLVNAMLALGCHFTNSPAGCADPNDPTTKGDAFFQEAKRLIVENDEYEKPRLTTIQALALMSVREAGCGREAKGWVYSGMSFRMAQDMGLNLESGGMTANKETMDEQEIDARRVTFWGCFLFDKCWSNYLGRLPQLPASNITVSKYDVFPDEDADMWSPYTDSGVGQMYSQRSRTRAVALQISALCEISSDLLIFFYHPQQLEKSQSKSAELKKLSELHMRLEAWRKDLPMEFEPKEGQLPNVLLMHMFFHLLYIHLFRPFLKYKPTTSPLPAHVSPRKLCTQAAALVSKLMRLYKRTYGLRQICNIAVYIVHSACTIHLLNLPEKTAKRDIVHGVKHLEEIAEDWLCARRTLSILSVLARKWRIELPEEASIVLARTDRKYGTFSTADVPSPKADSAYTQQMGSPSATPTLQVQSSFRPHNLFYTPPELNPKSTTSSSRVGNRVASSILPNELTNAYQVPPALQKNHMSPVSSPRPQDGVMSLPSESLMQMASPYSQRQHSTVSGPQQGVALQGADSGASSRTLTRHASPSTMFGGVDALVESQDWWLRDQASLAVGFENWDGLDQGGLNMAQDENMSGNGLGGFNEGFVMPQSGHNATGYGNDEWFY
ncbi:MAG: Nitrogen assimilation transcription factor nit-4 [Claussenomyces sp. TS43310]|nr:MAG: Nitrogen assimilation transcription factor nit-4 [Claussenomyces sp. TS43310]